MALPLTWEDKINSPQLLALLQQYGIKSYLDAEQINEIRDALNWLYNNVGGGSGVTNNTGFTTSDENYIFNALFGWRLNGVDYAITEDTIINVPFAADGYHRIDLIVANQTGLIRLPGAEVEISSSPSEPIYNNLTQLRITAIPVNSDGYGEPEGIEFLNEFVKKIEDTIYAYAVTGADQVLEFRPDGTANYTVTNSSLTSISGFGISLITGNPNAEPLRIGKKVILWNQTANAITLKNADAAEIPFNFSSDVSFPSGEKMLLFFDGIELRELFRSWSSSIGFIHRFLSPNFSPASNTTYYFAGGNLGTLASASTSNINRRLGCMLTGKVIKIHLEFSVGLSASAPNNLTVYLDNITQVSSLLITNSLIVTGNQGFVNLNVSSDFLVNKDDELTLRAVTPSWGSNPTNFNLTCDILIV
ncbi:hypothetical protein [Flavobacterium sp. HNIBRBA15423]|uniref:hypothetical protein n=1 Tax=Flavobacterium sp. HNIBRBA15423 TaxID=3458683 RepID=UPI0040449B14